jgi:hypothetical protein
MEQKIEPEPLSNATSAESGPDRRQHSRHCYARPIVVWFKDGSTHSGMSFELSQGGISAMIKGELNIGEQVELSTIVGYRLSGVVRRHHGKLYGFEFLNLTAEQSQKLADHCEKLPIFRSMLDV